jgi:hypothetical protein
MRCPRVTSLIAGGTGRSDRSGVMAHNSGGAAGALAGMGRAIAAPPRRHLSPFLLQHLMTMSRGLAASHHTITGAAGLPYDTMGHIVNRVSSLRMACPPIGLDAGVLRAPLLEVEEPAV